MSEASNVPQHTRAVPAEWPNLVAVPSGAENATQPTAEAPEIVLAKVEALGNEDLDANRYYALGELACEFSRELQENRGDIVQALGQEFYTHWAQKPWPRQRGLTFSELRKAQMRSNVTGEGMQAILTPYAQAGYNAVDPATRTAADALSVETSSRLRPLRYQGIQPFTTQEKLERMRENKYPAQELARNALTGTLRTFMLAASRAAGYDGPEPSPATYVASVLEPEMLEKLNLGFIAPRAAAIRIDEFMSDLPQYIKTLEAPHEERVAWNRRAVPRAGDLPETVSHLHSRRLKCPALYVRGLIPQVAELVLDGLAEGDSLTRQD